MVVSDDGMKITSHTILKWQAGGKLEWH